MCLWRIGSYEGGVRPSLGRGGDRQAVARGWPWRQNIVKCLVARELERGFQTRVAIATLSSGSRRTLYDTTNGGRDHHGSQII
jgi:hypothetical protein